MCVFVCFIIGQRRRRDKFFFFTHHRRKKSERPFRTAKQQNKRKCNELTRKKVFYRHAFQCKSPANRNYEKTWLLFSGKKLRRERGSFLSLIRTTLEPPHVCLLQSLRLSKYLRGEEGECEGMGRGEGGVGRGLQQRQLPWQQAPLNGRRIKAPADLKLVAWTGDGPSARLSVSRESSRAADWSLRWTVQMLQTVACLLCELSLPLLSTPPATGGTTRSLNWARVRFPDSHLSRRRCFLRLFCRWAAVIRHSCCAVGGCGGAAVRLARLSRAVSQRKWSQPLVLPLNWQSELPDIFCSCQKETIQVVLEKLHLWQTYGYTVLEKCMFSFWLPAATVSTGVAVGLNGNMLGFGSDCKELFCCSAFRGTIRVNVVL